MVFREIKLSIGAQLSNFWMHIYLIKSSLIYGDQLSKIRNQLIATHFKRLNYISISDPGHFTIHAEETTNHCPDSQVCALKSCLLF